MALSLGKDIHSNSRARPARSRIAAMAFLIGAFCSVSLAAEPARPLVDLELVLAVDVSSSMSLSEQRVQRDGYVSAFRHPDLAGAIGSGARGMIAVSYLEWAGPNYQRVVLPWTIVGSYDDAKRFADALAVEPVTAQAGTSISGALLSAGDLFAKSRTAAARRIIDVSGDGPNNAGLPVAPIRDRLTGSGITINGLPVSLPRGGSNGFQSFGEHYLNLYYERCVIGGPDSFLIGIDDLGQFEVAIRRKLLLEIAGMPARPRLASYSPAGGRMFDCSMIGTTAR
ncbi:MAG: DUF1194 domain-containing protein [Mesorhizobium sp.]|nr:MAG: DUF1194 domain-containing protein [Mesorhizobium sp.]TIW12928.1 MAG: DUF1194 domain-containing protein [Mesorhizobium sp.]TIW47839.1 MAG: DUF1194 domain-containing protein [Mesorhizobium sp.]TIW66515.1 MAG: DUF1194 domain-containing protein [Mesorhizobium sp.]TIX13012.1 MAG: DUF1194 domain-containing protein [Mesorhizobium sp.]